ncbi:MULTISPECIES: hypothetical protein [Legionella]|uniref:Uncharacterized protein n=1 Tax=Legionella resiliens TaxID=2905958 RepID=A0ABS8X336_9GAMM|nr:MULTISPECIES: hypothetical protein [unclassified Legionella]MCE0723231.1 hypothetical protein [Legionella sp. 9fVS26]MCE3532384.1 hypothetical protein [Legionella sp. 8cVS16]QLZ68524.1 hypothetical protein FOLKNPGA_01303 [Legionella sp. PC1000]
MPTLSIGTGVDSSPQIKSTHELSPGTYHTSALAMSEAAQGGGIEAERGTIGILKANDKRILFTHSLDSCFPAVFIFKNGDVGLYHGNTPFISNIQIGSVPGGNGLLETIPASEIEEIQIFEKGVALNTGKALTFAHNLRAHFKGEGPKILVQQEKDVNPADPSYKYGAAAIYRSKDGKPIILVGQSKPYNDMAKNQEECLNKEEDSIKPYTLVEFDPKTRPLPTREEPRGEKELKKQEELELTPKATPSLKPSEPQQQEELQLEPSPKSPEPQQQEIQQKMKSVVKGMRKDEENKPKEDGSCCILQ